MANGQLRWKNGCFKAVIARGICAVRFLLGEESDIRELTDSVINFLQKINQRRNPEWGNLPPGC